MYRIQYACPIKIVNLTQMVIVFKYLDENNNSNKQNDNDNGDNSNILKPLAKSNHIHIHQNNLETRVDLRNKNNCDVCKITTMYIIIQFC